MPDLSSVVAAISHVLGAALAGGLTALLARRWTRRSGRTPTYAEAAWCAFLPLLALLVVPLFGLLRSETFLPLGPVHVFWHEWEEAVHSLPLSHGALHLGNLLVLLTGVVCCVRAAFRLARTQAFDSTLRRISKPLDPAESNSHIRCIDSPHPACLTVGATRPSVYVTSGLLAHLPERERRAVLAHEAAHARGRHPLIAAILEGVFSLIPVPGARLLLDDWTAAAERLCDTEAALQVGRATDVAEALVRVAQLVSLSRSPLPGGSTFASSGEDVEGRVQALLALANGAAPSSRQLPRALAAASLALLFGTTLWLPHMVEFFAHH
jgi:Zn-dependent protease with chaperone function